MRSFTRTVAQVSMIMLLSKDFRGISHPSSGNSVSQEYPLNTTETRCQSWYEIRTTRQLYGGPHTTQMGNIGLYTDDSKMNDENRYMSILQGRKLKIATEIWPPYTVFTNKTKEQFSGFLMDVLEELSQLLEFSYTLEFSPDREWGAPKENGWSGLVGLLERREVDLVAAPLTYQPKRAEVMDFAVPFDTQEVKFWYLDPAGDKERWLIVFDLLDLHSALLVGATILCLAFFLTYTTYLLHRNNCNMPIWHYLTMVFQLFGVLMNEGVWRLPASEASKIFLACWWLFSLIFSATYGSILVATITANKTVLPFTTLEELTRQTEYKYGYLGSSATETLFASDKTEDMKLAWEKVHSFQENDPTVLSPNYKVHVDKMFKEKYVFITDELIWNESPDVTEQHSIISGSEVFRVVKYAIGLPLGSPFTDDISRGIRILREVGVLRKYERKWWPRTTAAGNNVNPATRLSLRKVQGAFYTIAAGVGMCMVVLLLEICHAKVHQKYARKLSK